MATHLREGTAIQTAADVCAGIASGLDSDPQTKHLAPTWDALTAKADSLANDRRVAERAIARIRASLDVADAHWDADVAAFGRDVVDQSGGSRDKAPYTRFFHSTTPSAAQTFGIEREVKQGQDWLAELGRNPDEDLAKKWSSRLGTVTEKLEQGVNARRNALQVLALQGTAEELFIDDVNRELDILEGDLLKLLPGQSKRVAAFLEPSRPRRKRGSADGTDS